MKRLHFGVWLVLLIAAGVAGCKEKIGPGATGGETARVIQAPVAEAAVTRQPFLYEAVGTISARTASTISSKLMGTVQAVHVREGDLVSEGDVLVTLDHRQVKAQLDKAQAGLREALRAEASAVSARDAADAAARLARSTYQRYQQLLKENSASLQEFEEVEARHRQAQAALAQTDAMLEAARSRIQQAEASVREATVANKDATVRAPYEGRVVNKMISVGDLASPGTPFFTVEQEGLYCADLVLPERHIQEVRVGLAVKVVVDALNNLETQGVIGRIIPSADARSRSFQLKVAMPETLDLKSGMFARVFIPIGGTGMLLVPRAAIKTEGQLTGVYVVGDNHIARFRLVRTGKQLGDRVEIISGLTPGQRYVMAIGPTLGDGVKVEEK